MTDILIKITTIATISWVVMLVVLAVLNDFGILNKEHVLIYYFSIFFLGLSINYYK